MDEGVVIKNFVNASRRAVFEIEYKNKRGVVKFSLAKHTYEQTENQQKREETRSHFAKMEGDQEHFALILLSDQNYDWVVQEWAERVNRYEYDDLPEELAETARKYGLNEIEAGYVNGKLKIVDYGY